MRVVALQNDFMLALANETEPEVMLAHELHDKLFHVSQA